jgi:hypothetical protein
MGTGLVDGVGCRRGGNGSGIGSTLGGGSGMRAGSGNVIGVAAHAAEKERSIVPAINV